MPEGQPLIYIVILAFITILLIGALYAIIPKKEVVNRFTCSCEIPELGNKKVTVIVQGDDLPSGVIAPTNLTLNVYNYSVPCSCETKLSLI
ncbi:TPA: hypothetical protein H1005_02610, partial [archaeon]|nr:hypothetical protein [Candidatus Naiadarchaeales archaeon SRR2090153.bin1042]